MIDYYKELSLSRNAESKQILDRIWEERKKSILRQNSADLDIRQKEERKIVLLNEANVIFSDEKKRADYDAALDSAESYEYDTQKTKTTTKPAANPTIKPTRKLYNGIDYDNGCFFKTEYGKYKVISANEAFEQAFELLVKMARLGPRQGQDTKAFHDEFLRLSRITNSDKGSVDYEVLDRSILKCASILWEIQDLYIANLLIQDFFYYSNELIDNRNSIDIGIVAIQFCKEQVFCEFLGRTEVYKEIVDAFFKVNRIDKSMPLGYYDLSYKTEETASYQDIYYLVMCDYYVKKVLEKRDQIFDEEIVDSCQRAHDLYNQFREVLDPIILSDRKRKNRLGIIYKEALEKMKYSENNDFNKDKPYHAGLAYAIGVTLQSERMCKRAANSLETSRMAYRIKKKHDAIVPKRNNTDRSKALQNIIWFCLGLTPILYFLYTGHYIVGGYSFLCFLILCARSGVKTASIGTFILLLIPIILVFYSHPFIGGAIALCLMSGAFYTR